MKTVILSAMLLGVWVSAASAITFRQAVLAGYEVKAVGGMGGFVLQKGKSVVLCNNTQAQCEIIE